MNRFNAPLFKIIFLGSMAFGGALFSQYTPDLDLSMAPSNITINNRVLIRVNGKPISVLDVVKKMDLLFYRRFPEHAESPYIRYQFYLANWKSMLTSSIDDRLILADAAEKKVEATEGDVREELEKLFGPEVVLNIDKLGMTYEEAFELIQTDLIVQKMIGAMVRAKALIEVLPKDVYRIYQERLKESPPEAMWAYRILSIRDEDETKRERVAKRALQLIDEEKVAFEMLPELLESEGAKVALSEEYERKDSELSLAYKAVLQTLATGGGVTPQGQVALQNRESVSRLFHLKEHKLAEKVAFGVIEKELHEELTQKAMVRNNVAYLKKLRQEFGLTDDFVRNRIPDDFIPFSIK